MEWPSTTSPKRTSRAYDLILSQGTFQLKVEQALAWFEENQLLFKNAYFSTEKPLHGMRPFLYIGV
jgi:hypothetical protein